MWYIARIPASENPANPDFHEVLCVDRSTGNYGWTPLLSLGCVFRSRDDAAVRLALLSKRDQEGAMPKFFRFGR